MLGHWFERGLGEIVAPSGGNGPEEEPLPPPMEHGVWQWVAPDPTFAAATPSHSSNSAERPSVAFQEDSDEHEHDGLVQCTHCRKWTPGQPPQDQHHSAGTPAKVGRTSTPFRTPQSASGSSSGQYWMDSAERVKALVTDAAVSTAQAKASTVGGLWEQRHKFFMLVSADPPLETDPKKEEKLRKFRKKILKLLKMDPSLARARCVDAQHHTIQEGYTPLHAAAAAGNCVAAQCLLDTCETPDELELILDERDFAGNTPLHIASEYGQLGMVQLLKSNSRTEPVGPNAPMDLLGRTPLGSALSSRKPNHRHNMGFIEKELFSPGDGSIMGKQTPAHERSGGLALSSRRRARSRLPTPSNNDDDNDDNEHVQDNNLLYGYSEMPGKRIIMEDAICAHYPLIPPKFANDDHELSSSKQRKHWVGFFGVFDGHGDGGAISKYVAEHVVNQVCGTNDWQSYVGGMDCLARALTKACTELDADMSKLSWSTNGGSTGIMAMISGDAIVVANVGDSRCILIQSPQTKHADAEEQTTMSQLTDSTTQLSLTSTEEQTDTKKESHKIVVVKALSEDHKPDLPVERMRIEEAGLTVVADTFLEEENDTETTIYKIEKSHNNKIAVSRAFGDFDYKDQPDKPLDQQAIVATPEIQIHARDPNRDLFLVLACDGVWDVMTNQEVGDFCAKTHAELLSSRTTTTPEQVLPEVGDRLLKECVEVRGTRDNVSVLIVHLQNTMNHPTTNLHAGTAVRALQFDD